MDARRWTGQTALLAGPSTALLIALAAGLAAEDAALPADPAALGEAVAALGRLDLVVIATGWQRLGPFMAVQPADWDAAVRENFELPVMLAQAAARAMLARGQTSGRLLFITGIEGTMPLEKAAVSGTTYSMLNTITRMIAHDLAPHGITANALAFGWVEGLRYAEQAPPVQAHIRAGIPAGRPARAEEAAAAALFLLSPAASYITGQILSVDGGYSLTKAPGKTLIDP